MFNIGAAKVDISFYEPGLGLMGWGTSTNQAHGVGLPLHARAFVIEDPSGQRLALVVADLCFISQALRLAVLERLEQNPQLAGMFASAQVMLSATHTHSGPGGLSHYLFYNLDSRGFSPRTLQQIADAMVAAIAQAFATRRPGRVEFKQGDLDWDAPVAFNRAIEAYMANPEQRGQARPKPEQALDRRMRLLHFVDDKGQDIGQVNWFAVHGTTVHSDNTALHADNKGEAAARVEHQRNLAAADFVAAFAQGACGDVTPNFRWDGKRKKVVGSEASDFDSAKANGALQAAQALKLLDQQGQTLHDSVDAVLLFNDFSQTQIDPEFADGATQQSTQAARIGLRMLVGTAEGPGLPYRLAPLLGTAASGLAKAKQIRGRLARNKRPEGRATDNKIPFMDTGLGKAGKILNVFAMDRPLPIPKGVEPMIDDLNALIRRGGLNDKPWTPQILPVQIARIGELAIVAMPAEFTTTAGRRVVALIRKELAEAGIQEVIFNGYANSYAGYVTTPEEYRLQGYEGASTHFGPHTLGAYLTVTKALCQRLSLPPSERPDDSGPSPLRFSEAELAQQLFPLLS